MSAVRFAAAFAAAALTLSAPAFASAQSGDAPSGPVQWSDIDVSTPEGVRAIAAFAEGLGPEWPLVLTAEDSAPPKGVFRASGLVKDAHSAGLAVHPWTVRAENTFLPRFLRKGTNAGDHGAVNVLYAALYATGVDGLFSDFPGLAVQARSAFMRGR